MVGLRQMGQRAMRLAEAGQHAQAVALWQAMDRQAPGNAGIGLALGAALMAAKRVDEAGHWLASCSQRYPADPKIATLHGRTLVSQRQRKQAIGAFFHALSLDPDCVETHGHLASALFADRASALALPHAVRACRGDLSEFHMSTYLCILLDLGEGEQGLEFIDRVMTQSVVSPAKTLMYRAAALQALGRVAEGLVAAREAVRLAPDNHVARHHLAAALLAQGDLSAEAWANYEGRAALMDMQHWPQPRYLWIDQEIDGRTIVVHAEQGLGDTLQFIRYVPLLAARGARVIAAVQPSLVGVLQGTPGADQVIAAGNLPAFDYYCPLLSLPGRFGTTLETIPPPLPYALALPQRPRSPRLQVGIVWAGGDAFIEDRKRSLDPAALAPLGTVFDVDFHSLQFGAETLPLPGMRNAMEGVRDFADTACRIAMLDLVIAVDTSVAHLAATMGKPVWMLTRHNGCWRWLLEREDTPWYPTMRIFRQANPNDWASVIEQLRAALTVAAARHREAMLLAA